jgi:hypothetical protein
MSPLKMGVMGLVVFILVVLFLGMWMKSARGFEGFQEGAQGACHQATEYWNDKEKRCVNRKKAAGEKCDGDGSKCQSGKCVDNTCT